MTVRNNSLVSGKEMYEAMRDYQQATGIVPGQVILPMSWNSLSRKQQAIFEQKAREMNRHDELRTGNHYVNRNRRG